MVVRATQTRPSLAKALGNHGNLCRPGRGLRKRGACPERARQAQRTGCARMVRSFAGLAVFQRGPGVSVFSLGAYGPGGRVLRSSGAGCFAGPPTPGCRGRDVSRGRGDGVNGVGAGLGGSTPSFGCVGSGNAWVGAGRRLDKARFWRRIQSPKIQSPKSAASRSVENGSGEVALFRVLPQKVRVRFDDTDVPGGASLLRGAN